MKLTCEKSGFEATFQFEVADAAALKGLELAVETPELYKVSPNDKPVAFTSAKRWLDPHLISVSIENLAKAGVNEVRIAAAPFDVKMELENIYLRGNFTVEAARKGFQLKGPRALDFGSWRKQGYLFYGDSVTYSTSVAVPAGGNGLRVKLPECCQPMVPACLPSSRTTATLPDPFEAEFTAGPGKHRVAVKIVSNPRNVFGPFHNPSKPRMRAWPAAWAEFPGNQPGGSAYDLLDYGLMAAPEIRALL